MSTSSLAKHTLRLYFGFARSRFPRLLTSNRVELIGVLAFLFACVSNAAAPPGNKEGFNAIVCWGDSMTAGNEGITDQGAYPELLQEEIGSVVINEGVNGQTSTQIGVRQGGIASYATVVGGTIPAYGNGAATVLFKAGYEPLTRPNSKTRGSILGVEGDITLSGSLPGGQFTFTPVLGSRAVSAVGTQQFFPDSTYKGYVSIFWEGRNNLVQTGVGPWGQSQILADIAAQVSTVPSGVNYLVLSVLNKNNPSERKGENTYSKLLALNDALSATYGTHYLDIRSILVNSFNRSLPVDVSDYENDVQPTSLGAIAAEGTLARPIDVTDKSFEVNVTAGTLRANQHVVIDNESIFVLSVNGSTVTSSIRGYGGIVSSHAVGVQVDEYDGTHLNKRGYAIVAKAVAGKLATRE